MHRCTGTSSPNTCRIALRSALEPSITNSIPCSTSRPRDTRSDSSALVMVAFSVLPLHSPNASFSPSVVIPNATTFVRPLISIPSSITTANRRSASCRDIRCHSASRARSTNARDTELFDVDRSRAVACSPTLRRLLQIRISASDLVALPSARSEKSVCDTSNEPSRSRRLVSRSVSADSRRRLQAGRASCLESVQVYRVCCALLNIGAPAVASPAGTRRRPTIRSAIMFWKRWTGSSKR
jgi:hypothetical protein